MSLHPYNPAVDCCFCDGRHKPEECPVVYTPIKDCSYKDRIDGCCLYPGALTPECHVNACPRLHPNIIKDFNAQHP